MALPGFPPSDHSINRNPKAEWVDVPDAPYTEGTRRSLPDGRPWNILTVNWWKAVRVLPHAVLWNETDWISVVDLAILKDKFYAGQASASEVVEIRQREARIGMTLEDRRKMRLRYVKPRPESGAGDEALADGVNGNVTPIRRGRRSELLDEA